ncbi:MAG: hypothetical protein SGPRY_010274, partial [Prymnesium sp.]
ASPTAKSSVRAKSPSMLAPMYARAYPSGKRGALRMHAFRSVRVDHASHGRVLRVLGVALRARPCMPAAEQSEPFDRRVAHGLRVFLPAREAGSDGEPLASAPPRADLRPALCIAATPRQQADRRHWRGAS